MITIINKLNEIIYYIKTNLKKIINYNKKINKKMFQTNQFSNTEKLKNNNIIFQNNSTLNNNNFQNTKIQNQYHTIQIPYKIQKKQSLSPILVDTNGNKPLPRFGHTLLSLSQVKLILFGGAVGDVKNYKCSNDIYILNLMTKIWTKINYPQNSLLPKERAAHAATINNNKMYIHGGSIGGCDLAEDELWYFDMNKYNNYDNNYDNCNYDNNYCNDDFFGYWKLLNINGPLPGKRYGHSLSSIQQFLILFGGNSILGLSNETWIIDISIKESQWVKIQIDNNDNFPCPRLYHSYGICDKGNAKGMLIIFGGRDLNDNALNDIWGLRRHRNGKWDWIKGPIKNNYIMKSRYNQSCVFYNTLMILIGGKNNKGNNNIIPIEVYDTEKNEVWEFPGVGMVRQSSFILDNYLFFYGGFAGNNQIQPIGVLSKINLEGLFKDNNFLIGKLIENNNNYDNNYNNINNNYNNNYIFNHFESHNKFEKKIKFKLSHDVVIGSSGFYIDSSDEDIDDTTSLFRKVSIEKLPDEKKKLISNDNENNLIQSKHIFNYELINKFIEILLRPFEYFDNNKMDSIHKKLPFTSENILNLLNEVKPILENENSLIRIRSPCKIFGNLYGDYNDLMRYFESFGNPSDDNQMGDINVMQYIFLGDFCDRGFYSLEIIFLLFALKVKYPNFIYLIRGHHEDINININYGLNEECKQKIKCDEDTSIIIFNKINEIFNYLPFGILVDNSILCIHSGIGSTINTLNDINNIKRPINIIHDVINRQQQIVLDLLWSEYSDKVNDVEVNYKRDKLKKGFIVKFGKNRLNKFMNDNKISLIINSHKFINEGFKTFNDEKLLTIFSGSNYMDKYNNMGVMIIIGKKNFNKPMNIIPRLINGNEKKNESYRKNRSPSPI